MREARRRSSSLLVFLLLLQALGGFAIAKTFNPTAGPPFNWSDPANWSPAGIPALTDDVTISTGTVTLDQPETIASLTVSGGSIAEGASGALTVAGNVSVTGGTYDTGIPLTMNGGVAQQLSSNLPLGPLTISNAGTTVTLGSAVQTASLLQTGGTLDVGAGFNYQLTVAGNWNRTAGTFNPRAGTVVFSATASIQYAETFNNLTVNAPGSTATLAFPNASTMTVGGNLTIANGTLSTSTLWDNVNSPQNPILKINGNLLLNGGTLDISQAPKPTSGTNPWTDIDIYGSLSGAAGGTINGGPGGASGSFASLRFRGIGSVDFTNIAYSPGNVRIWFAGTSTTASSTTFNPAGRSVASVRIGSSGLQAGGALVLTGDLVLTGNDWTGSGAFSVGGGATGTLPADSIVINSGVTVTANSSGIGGMTQMSPSTVSRREPSHLQAPRLFSTVLSR